MTLLVPYEGSIPPEADVSMQNAEPGGAERVRLDIAVGPERFRVGYDTPGKES